MSPTLTDNIQAQEYKYFHGILFIKTTRYLLLRCEIFIDYIH